MTRQASPEDLLVLARQCRLSDQDERRLEMAMQASRELECLYDAGLHFDQEAGVLSGDEKRLSRLVRRALEGIDHGRDGASEPHVASAALPAAARPHRGPALRYFAGSMALGMLLCITLASAWAYVEKRLGQQQAQQDPRATSTEAAAAASARRRPSTRIALPAPAPVATPVESSLGAPLAPPPRPVAGPAGPRKADAEEPSSPSELFARANQARRKGDIEAAISLYERLARAYPSSTEAEDAKILRGNLLLMQRSPRAALRQFEDYQRGALSLEALWGRAQALRTLESSQERGVLLEIVRDHPDSPYAQAAKKRLGELGP
jgi:TolA-binding protein